MKIEEIRHIADIAKLHFEEEELMAFSKDFNETMALVDSLKEEESEGAALLHVNDLQNHWHKDEGVEGLNQKEATQNAPQEKYGYFQVVKFVD